MLPNRIEKPKKPPVRASHHLLTTTCTFFFHMRSSSRFLCISSSLIPGCCSINAISGSRRNARTTFESRPGGSEGDELRRWSCVTRTSHRAFSLMTFADLCCLFLFRWSLLRRGIRLLPLLASCLSIFTHKTAWCRSFRLH